MVEWPRGEATACKAVYTGSNPVSTSSLGTKKTKYHRGRLAQGLARFLDMEEVIGSIPISPTNNYLFRLRSECPAEFAHNLWLTSYLCPLI